MKFDHYYYHPDLTQSVVTLSAEESEHCVRVLRHKAGDCVWLTDGKGHVAEATILADYPKACMVELGATKDDLRLGRFRLHLAVAPTKNADRMEWLVEKCVEIGIGSISFIICEHSERKSVNLERLHRVAVAALKQCQTAWLPPMEVISFHDFLDRQSNVDADKYIAWCDNGNMRQLANESFRNQDVILLIGPEGDFSSSEIMEARSSGYAEVKLGGRRLRTETAGLYGCLTVAVKSEMKQI